MPPRRNHPTEIMTGMELNSEFILPISRQYEPIPHETRSNQHIITYRGQSSHIRGHARLRFDQLLDNFNSLKLVNKWNHKNRQPPTVNRQYIKCDLIVLHVKIVVIN